MSNSALPVERGKPHSARRLLWIWLAAAFWICGAVTGLWVLWAYENTPGVGARSLREWPATTRLTRASGRPTLVLLAHPQCSCTRASLAELGELLARGRVQPKTYVLFLKPAGFAEGWEQTDLWRAASALPHVTIVRDDEGIEAERFGAVTSGQALLYSADGTLVFSGGITGARGHAGNNPGRMAILAWLDGRNPGVARTSVFGCSLLAPRTES